MILRLNCAFLFVLCSSLLSAHTFNADSTELKVTYIYQQKALSSGEDVVLTDSMGLLIDNNKSVYFDLDLAKRDSIENSNFRRIKQFNFSSNIDELERQMELRGRSDAIIGNLEHAKSHFYKDRNINQIVTKHRTSEPIKGLKVIEEIEFDWDISNADTDTILGYHCMLATTQFRGRTYSAWFAFDVPINDGPWKFHGLPGLILKVEDSKGIFTFKAIGLERVNKQEVKYNFVKEEVVTNKQLKDYINNIRRTISYGFYDGNTATYYGKKSDMIFPELEIEDE